MSTDPSELRAQIEQTRSSLSDDVDALAYEANPKTMAHRQVQKVKAKGTRVIDRILGTAEDVKDAALDKVHAATDAIGGAASDAGDGVANLPATTRAQAQGNPVVAGLVAFGLGMLIAAAIPPSEKEQELAETLKDKSQPLVDHVSDVVKEVGQNLAQPAGEAVDALKETAAEAVANVRDEGSAAVSDVQGEMQDSAAEVTGSAKDSVGQLKAEAQS